MFSGRFLPVRVLIGFFTGCSLIRRSPARATSTYPWFHLSEGRDSYIIYHYQTESNRFLPQAALSLTRLRHLNFIYFRLKVLFKFGFTDTPVLCTNSSSRV
jgi:hypothetical protein